MTAPRFALPFRSHAVVQADRPLPVWGFAAPNSRLVFTCNHAEFDLVADEQGRWEIELPPQEAGAALTFSIRPQEGEEVVAHDILAGDVLLCSGQSNMEWNLGQIDGTAARDAITSDEVRFVRLPVRNSDHALSDTPGDWALARGHHASECSAIGFFVAHRIQKVTGRPVGFIVNAVGGTMVETWLQREVAMSSSPGKRRAAELRERYKAMLPRLRQHAQDFSDWVDHVEACIDAGDGVTYRRKPDLTEWPQSNQIAGCWNAMMAPLRGLSLRAVLWYQGESNVDFPEEYAELFRLMVKSWRADLHEAGKLPFFWVQLAGFCPEEDRDKTSFDEHAAYARLRQAQEDCLNLPYSGMVSAIDVGDRLNIHPFDKETVAERLAAMLLHRLYACGVAIDSPRILSAAQEGNCVFVSINQALQTRQRVQGFHVEFEGEWHTVSGRCEGNLITLDLPGKGIASRLAYARGGWQSLNLCNDHHWPLLPALIDV